MAGNKLFPDAATALAGLVADGQTLAVSTDALPSRATSGHDAVRTVATTARPCGASTVTIALPA